MQEGISQVDTGITRGLPDGDRELKSGLEVSPTHLETVVRGAFLSLFAKLAVETTLQRERYPRCGLSQSVGGQSLRLNQPYSECTRLPRVWSG